jgi:arylsulfatase A-like enzyme
MAGLYIGSGPAFDRRKRGEPASILDVFQTVLALAGLAPPDDRRGRPLPSARLQAANKVAQLEAEEMSEASTDDEDASVRERLKGLGYLE